MKKYHLTIFAGLALPLAILFFNTNSLAYGDEDIKKESATVVDLNAELPSVAQRYVNFYSSSQLAFSIDPDSIVIQPGAEYEVRFTLKATSKQGATNVSYEGLRCSNRQKIIYAIGRADGSWSRTRSPEWNAIYASGINIQHATLANEYFCSGNTFSGSLSSIKTRLESKRPISNT